MKTCGLFTFILFCNTILCSQPSTFVVKAGTNASMALPKTFRYLYPEYQDGYLLLWSGKKSPVSKFNYDMLNRSLIFINEKNDTLTITNDEAVRFAHIGNEDFLHDNKMGYLKLMIKDSLHILASHEQLEEVRHTQAGSNGYGTVDVGSSYSAQRRTSIRWVRDFDVTYGRVVEYYLIDQGRTIIKANKSGFLDMFSRHEGYVKSYMKKENIDFKKEEDIAKLYKYCISLMAVYNN